MNRAGQLLRASRYRVTADIDCRAELVAPPGRDTMTELESTRPVAAIKRLDRRFRWGRMILAGLTVAGQWWGGPTLATKDTLAPGRDQDDGGQ